MSPTFFHLQSLESLDPPPPIAHPILLQGVVIVMVFTIACSHTSL